MYMDDEIIRVRLNVDKALVENETEKKKDDAVVERLCVYITSITPYLLTVGH